MPADRLQVWRKETLRRIKGEMLLSQLAVPDGIPPANRAERREADRCSRRLMTAARALLREIARKREDRARKHARRLERQQRYA